MSAPDRSAQRALEDALFFARRLPVECDGISGVLKAALRRVHAAPDSECALTEEQARGAFVAALRESRDRGLFTGAELVSVLAILDRAEADAVPA